MAMFIAIYVNLQVGSDAYITLGLTNTPRWKTPNNSTLSSCCHFTLWLAIRKEQPVI